MLYPSFEKTKHSFVRIKRIWDFIYFTNHATLEKRASGKCIWFWGWWNVQSPMSSYILCFHMPCCECCPPHVALQLFQCRSLSVQRHLPAHIIYHGLDHQLQVICSVLRCSRDRNSPIQVGVLFSLEVINNMNLFLNYLKKESLKWDLKTSTKYCYKLKYPTFLVLIWMIPKRNPI